MSLFLSNSLSLLTDIFASPQVSLRFSKNSYGTNENVNLLLERNMTSCKQIWHKQQKFYLHNLMYGS